MKSVLLIAAVLCAANLIHAQSPDTLWTRTYGGSLDELCLTVCTTSDGGFALSGYTSSFGYPIGVSYLVRTDANGDTLFTRVYGSVGSSSTEFIMQTPDHGFILAGQAQSEFGGWDYNLRKTDSAGFTQWDSIYTTGPGTDGCYDAIQTSDGGYILVGYTDSFGTGQSLLMKTDSTGRMQWLQRHGGGPIWEAYTCVLQLADNSYILGGYIIENHNQDLLLRRVSSRGDSILWEQHYGGDSTDICEDVEQTSDGGFILVGQTRSYGHGNYDVWLIKTDSLGNMQWNSTFGGSAGDGAMCVVRTSENYFLIGGYTASFGAGGYDMYMLLTDSTGNLVWQQTYGGTGNDACYDLKLTQDGGCIAGGITNSFGAGGSDFYAVRLDTVVNAIGPHSDPANITGWRLSCPYPNPFNPSTTLSYELRVASHVSLKIYDLSGRLVETLVDGWRSPGKHRLTFDGSRLASGIYLARLEAGSFTAAQKLVLLK